MPAGGVDVPGRIDRTALVRRHCPVVREFDPFAALTVGNGEFAFTADATGLQSFPDLYANQGIPLCTAAHWGWHSFPLPEGVHPTDIRATDYDTHGRPVGYVTDRTGQEALFDWLRQNPHRLHLGRLGLEMQRADGTPVTPNDLADLHQTLDLWTGLLHSRFTLEGAPVTVLTACHPDQDLLAVRVTSPLIVAGRLRLVLAFPYGSPRMDMADWQASDHHQTQITQRGNHSATLARTLDNDRYHVHLSWADTAAELTESGPHTFTLSSSSGDPLELSCLFAAQAGTTPELPTVDATAATTIAHSERFWSEGGVVDLSESADPRAPELERRVVLSQYLTAIHSAGSLPPAETGLLCNSWYGKFHLEMHWWHGVHFATWGRFPLLARSLDYYQRILPGARALAARQGYAGARWPKMVGPDGNDSPSPVGPLLIWQQPHPLYYAELAYRESPTPATLAEWAEVVFATADFMASYAFFDEQTQHYVLGPPLKTVSENTEARVAADPAFELSYWRFGLRAAQTWRERMGLPLIPAWETIINDLSPLPVSADGTGTYLLQAGLEDTYTRWNWEHPAQLGAFGLLPDNPATDPETMRRTVRRVMETWQWARKSWGWDYPMAAMAAARSGEPELAIQALLLDTPTNRVLPNGHVYQRPDLPAYLPANGGLLSAVGMMAAGWTGAPTHPAPGFPADGNWTVRCEGVKEWI